MAHVGTFLLPLAGCATLSHGIHYFGGAADVSGSALVVLDDQPAINLSEDRDMEASFRASVGVGLAAAACTSIEGVLTSTTRLSEARCASWEIARNDWKARTNVDLGGQRGTLWFPASAVNWAGAEGQYVLLLSDVAFDLVEQAGTTTSATGGTTYSTDLVLQVTAVVMWWDNLRAKEFAWARMSAGPTATHRWCDDPAAHLAADALTQLVHKATRKVSRWPEAL